MSESQKRTSYEAEFESENESENKIDSKNSESKSKGESTKEDFAKLLAESFKSSQKKFAVGDRIRGEILVIGKEEVFVSTGKAGSQSDGIVHRRDLLDAQGEFPYKVGDVLDLYIIQLRGSEIFLSPKSTSKNSADGLEDAFDMMIPIEGRVSEVCKGGVRVSIQGKTAFCPISQLDTARVETPEDYVGKKFEFLITQFSERGRNIVVSRRRILEDQRELTQGAFAEERQTGDVVSGKVKRLEPFGAFVEVSPGVEGLLHVSELSWSRVGHPSEVVTVGQDIQVKVLSKESKEGRLKISLSLKQVGPAPWENLSPHLKVGARVEGKVTRLMKFGAFVEVAPGIEGLIPLSEMSDTKRVMRADEFVKEGAKVSVLIKEIHQDAHRMTLSLKEGGDDSEPYEPQAPMGSFGTLGEQFKKALEKKKK